MRIIPRGRQHHRACEQLGAGQGSCAARYGVFIKAKPPAGIEWLTKDPRLVTGHDRLKPELGRHGVHSDRPVQQGPRRHRIGKQGNAVIFVLGPEISGAETGDGLGVGLDQDLRARMFDLCKGQHLFEQRGTRARGRHRGIIQGLINYQNITWRGTGRV